MITSKKKIELHRLTCFKELIDDFPVGQVEPSEKPDFIVRAADRMVGFELTDLYRESFPDQMPQQASEAMRHKVVERAKNIFDSRGLPPVKASFHFNDRIHIKKSEVEPFALELANLVSDNLPASESGLMIPDGWQDTRLLPNILHKLTVHRLEIFTKTFFSSPSATWVSNIRRLDIERILADKEPKLKSYRTRCDEAWLVINADIESMATWFEFDSGVLQEAFQTKFDRVYLVEHFRKRAHQLRITN